jgi:hypothetical protein
MPLAIEQDKNTASSQHRNLDRRGIVLSDTSRRRQVRLVLVRERSRASPSAM